MKQALWTLRPSLMNKYRTADHALQVSSLHCRIDNFNSAMCEQRLNVANRCQRTSGSQHLGMRHGFLFSKLQGPVPNQSEDSGALFSKLCNSSELNQTV